MKTTLALLVLFAVVVGGGYLWNTHKTQEVLESAPAAVSGIATTTPAASSSAPQQGDDAVQAPVPGPKPSTNPGTYTLAQVAVHNKAGDCWATINGSVYDLTSWVNQHPGGAARILSICGKDGTQAFTAQHSGDSRPQSVLAGFKIGTLAQ